MSAHLAGGDVVVALEGDVEEALVVSKIQINLAAVVEYIDLTCRRS